MERVVQASYSAIPGLTISRSLTILGYGTRVRDLRYDPAIG